MEVCCCPRRQGLLIYEFGTQSYLGQGGCEPTKICATLMIAKHRALLSKRQPKKRSLRETTLDEFFN